MNIDHTKASVQLVSLDEPSYCGLRGRSTIQTQLYNLDTETQVLQEGLPHAPSYCSCWKN